MNSDISYNKQYDIMEQLAETDSFSDDESDTYSTDSYDVVSTSKHNCEKNEINNDKKGTVIIESYCLSEDENNYDDWEEVNLNDVIINTMQNQNYFKDKKV